MKFLSHKTSLATAVALAFFLSAPAAAVTIDFDGLTPGTPVAVIGDVTFSIQPASAGLVVGTGLATTSGANYLAAGSGDGSFLPGDVIQLTFATPVQAVALSVISSAGAAPGAFTLWTAAGSDSSAAPDAMLGFDEVHNLTVAPGTPFLVAELRAAAGGLFAFGVDDIDYTVPEPNALLGLGLLGLSWVSRRKSTA